MVLANHIHKGLQQPYSDVISTIIVVTITWEVALSLKLDRETCLITYDINLCILDSRDRVNHMTEASDTRCESTTYVSVNECELCSLIEVLVVHVMDEVQCVYIDTSQPLHHIHEARHELIVCYDITLYWTISRSTLLTCLAVNTTADSISKTFSEVCTCTKELHLLTRLCCRYAAADRIVIAPYWSHHVIILILNRACRDRNLRSIVLEVLWKT